MNRKYSLPIFALWLLATMARAQSGSSLDTNGWQTAQVQIPQRPVPSNRRVPTPVPPSPTPPAPAAPVALPAPGGVPPVMPAPGTPPAAANMAGAAKTAAKAASTNEVADITYNFPGVPVEQLLDIYADLVGRTLLRSSTGASAVAKDATIALKTQTPLTRSEAIVALETILGMNGITIVPIGDKFAKVVAESVAGQEGGLISTNLSDVPEAGKMVTQIIQVKFTALQDLTDVLQPFAKMPKGIIALPSTQTLILRDYAENVDRMVEMVKRIDVLTPLIIKPQVIKIKYALASDIASALSALGASGGTSVGKSTSGANFGGSRSGGMGGGMNGMSGGMNGMGGGMNGSSGNGVFGSPSGNTSALGSQATSGRSSFQNNLNKIVQNAANGGQFQLFGQTKIIADERTNSLLVFANDEDMKMIMDIINKLDVVLQQVLIDAVIMEIDLDGSQSTGVSYLSQRQGGGTFTGAGGANNLSSGAASFLGGGGSNSVSSVTGSTLAALPSGFSYFSRFGDDLNVVMEAVASDSRSIILSRPRIQTSHAVPADMFIGQTVPYITGSYSYGYSTGPSSQYSQLEVGIHLQILPLINPDGLVVMDIQADVEGITGYTSINGSQVPITSKQQAGAKVAVRDGETILLGGFIKDNPTTTSSGVPVLMDIPWLGNIFKSRSTTRSREELVMLMRPTVLPTPEIAAYVATQERNKLTGVKQAELELKHEEEDRNKAIEAQMVRDAEKRAKEAKKEAKKDAEKKAKEKPIIVEPAPPPAAIQVVPTMDD